MRREGRTRLISATSPTHTKILSLGLYVASCVSTESPHLFREPISRPSDIRVVYSTEVPGEVKLLPLPEEEFKKGSVKELGAFDDFRVRILPVLGPLPAVFGLNAATYIILDLAGKPLTDASEIKNRKKLYQTMERSLSEREARVETKLGRNEQGLQGTIAVNVDDIAFVFEDVNSGRTTFDGVIVTKPQAVHWDQSLPLTADNMAIMAYKDAQKHEKEHQVGGKGLVELYGQDNVDIAQRRNEEVRRVLIWRRG